MTTTTTTPTLATLRAQLAAVERLLADANDEVAAAQEALDDAIDALDARADGVRPSACVGGGWDVDVTLVDVDGSTIAEGEVTLVTAFRDGRPSAYTGGGLETWVSHGLIGTLARHRHLVGTVEHVAREAIEASDVPRSPECEG